MKKCFVVCPIGSEESETRKHSDKLFKHVILPICTECNLETVRIDKEYTNTSIPAEILRHLTDDDIVIADLTNHNPNAFYELGYRKAINKPVIQLVSKEYSIPFDVSDIRTIDYDLSDLDSVANVKTSLKQTIDNVLNNSSSPAVQNITSRNHTKDFEKFKELMSDDYSDFHKALTDKCDSFSNGKNFSDVQKSNIYAEICSLELLRRYHVWLNQTE